MLELLTAEQDRFYDTRFDIGLPARRLCRAARWLGEQDATAILPLGLSRASTGAAAARRLARPAGPGHPACCRGAHPSHRRRQ
ncbi:hypothetical protein [Massilia sp. 9096]|uniref:hypothetical protein n=1 Tax=Massilia sp. 9096 TaxID=1500894 RepID=UPI0012E02073|nr:hypothetical protein [Massilia sp. 9096]